jgi:tight adherence protein C
MTPLTWGVVLGAFTGLGIWLVIDRLLASRHTSLALRVTPYLRDLPTNAIRSPSAEPTPAFVAIFGPLLRHAAELVERVLGGSASIARRLERARLPMTVHDFRISQAVWGLVGFLVAAAPSSLVALRSPERAVPLLVVCGCAFALGVLLRENRLTAQVNRRERRILEELPTVAELLALAVAAGESPLAALDRVVRRSSGELSADLQDVLSEVRTGAPIARAFDDLAARSGLPAVSRFAEGIAIAVERGTPLADVLHAQAGDVREAGRRALIESGARREVLMMVPVVFLVLPTVVVFAFWPGLVGLRLVVP